MRVVELLVQERAAGARGAGHRHAARDPGLRGLGGQGRGPVNAQLKAARFDDAMIAALAAGDVLAADEYPVDLLSWTNGGAS
jgi:hypothetical protein